MPGDTGEPTLKDLAPHWLSGDGLYSGGWEELIMVTKEFRVVISTDWLVLK